MPKRDIRLGPRVLRRQPPVIGIWCNPPSSTNAKRDGCAHPSTVCKGEVQTCSLCEFTFCASHYPRHQRRFECPIDIWRTFDARRKAWYEKVKANPKARPAVDVHFPDEPQVQEGGDG